MKTLFFTCSMLLLLSCSKELSFSGKDASLPSITEGDQLKEFLTSGGKKFTLKKFYSDIPVDYNPQDNNPELETDLTKYIIPYLRDDYYEFYPDGRLRITQNVRKHPGIEEEQFFRNYSIRTQSDTTVMDFVEHTYNQYQYSLAEMGSDFFIIQVKSGEATLYSRYEVQ